MDLYVRDKMIHFFNYRIDFDRSKLISIDSSGFFPCDEGFYAENDIDKNKIIDILNSLNIEYFIVDICPSQEQIDKKLKIDGKITTRTQALQYLIK